MKIISNTLDFEWNNDTAVAIGKFDGLHLGHRKLLAEILAKKQQGLDACVLTFDPSPAVFFGYSDGRELTTGEEKRRAFAELGVDVLVEFPMGPDTAAMAPERFVEEVLVKGLCTKWIAAGSDLSFGDRGAGNEALLRRLSERFGYAVTTIEKLQMDGQEVSSSLVRSLVEAGEMEKAERLLGSPYSITGTVEHGRKLGRTLGMPTVNLVPEQGKLLPPKGVYLSQVLVDGQIYNSISNIGCKPTVSQERRMGVETYLYDFEQNIYGKEITVQLRSFRRPEMQFGSVEELKAQMAADIAEGKNWHLSKKG